MGRESWGLAAAEVRVKPEGGYRFITSDELCLAWALYRERRVSARGLRTYFAIHEMAARRAAATERRTPRFTLPELLTLLGESEARKGRAALRELEQCGLVAFSEREISFKRASDLPSVPACLHTMLAEFKNPNRAVPVPRRVLRLLAVRSGRGFAATTLAHVLRCMRFLRKRGCVTSGLCHPRWVAELFGVSVSAVKAAREELEREGLLLRAVTPRWVCRRFGSRMSVNPEWCQEGASAHDDADPKSGLSSPAAGPKSGLHDSQLEPSSTYRNQEPAFRRATGFHGNKAKPETPQLNNIQPRDLREMGRLEVLYREACSRKLAQDTESGFYEFVALAERAKRVGQNPTAVFATLLRGGRFGFIANEDEDRAQARIRVHRDGPVRREGRSEPRVEDVEGARREFLRRQLQELLRNDPSLR